jgi:hypothetical protein
MKQVRELSCEGQLKERLEPVGPQTIQALTNWKSIFDWLSNKVNNKPESRAKNK